MAANSADSNSRPLRAPQSFWATAWAVVRLGLPVLITQVGFIITGFADNIMVGRYATDALAAASFVNNVFNIPLFLLLGFSYGLTPLIGALYARGSVRRIGQTVRAALLINALVGAVVVAAMVVLYFNIHRLGQPHELLPLMRPYYILYLCGLIPIALYNVFAQWSYALRNTAMPMWIILGANLFNILGNYFLIFGSCGAPELGLFGAGLATLAARLGCALVIIGVFFLKPSNAPYRRAFLREPVHTATWRTVFATSWPVSLQMTFETTSFSGCTILCGWLGQIPLAAFQIVMVVGTLGFCFYYAMATSVAVMVSNEAGAASPAGMRRVAWAGYTVILALAALSCTLFITLGPHLMALFSDDPAVVACAVAVILPLVLYQLADATQINFANALRGTSNVRPMMWIALLSYIFIGFPAAWTFAFPLHLGFYGIVLSFSIPLFLAAVLYLLSFLRTCSRFSPRKISFN